MPRRIFVYCLILLAVFLNILPPAFAQTSSSCESYGISLETKQFAPNTQVDLSLHLTPDAVRTLKSQKVKSVKMVFGLGNQLGPFNQSEESKTLNLPDSVPTQDLILTHTIQNGVLRNEQSHTGTLHAILSPNIDQEFCGDITYNVGAQACVLDKGVPDKLPINSNINISFNGRSEWRYYLWVYKNYGFFNTSAVYTANIPTDKNGFGSFKNVPIQGAAGDKIRISITKDPAGQDVDQCQKEITIDPKVPPPGSINQCSISWDPNDPTEKEKILLKVSGGPPGSTDVKVDGVPQYVNLTIDNDGNGQVLIGPLGPAGSIKRLEIPDYRVPGIGPNTGTCFNNILIRDSQGAPPRQPPSGGGGGGGGGTGGVTPAIDCTKKENEGKCSSSAGDFCDATHIKTAIGCVPTDPFELINDLLRFSVSVAGGIALLLMMAGSFQMVTSNGDPKALDNGRGQFVAALEGLLFVVFSVLLLKIIGVDILGLGTLIKGVPFGK